MKILRCFFALVQICVLSIMLSGASGGGGCNTTNNYGEPPSADAAFVEAVPASGDLAANGTITVTFDNDPGDVAVGPVGTVSGLGNTRIIVGPFTPGPLNLTLVWTNGSDNYTLTYNVTAGDTTTPTVTGGTVKDGEEDVDYEKINEGKTIEITFSEEVSGNIALQTEDGDFVGWIGKVEGMKGTLELTAGKELSSQTTYVIECIVVDGAGNELDVSISFKTKDKE